MEDTDIARLNATEYKAYHESLMQNNHGSSAVHVFFCILFTVQCSIYSSVKVKAIPDQQISEYIVIVLPLILAHTVLSDYIYILNLIVAAFLFYEISSHMNLIYVKKMTRVRSYHRRIQTISVLRGLTYLITVLCILAVDFKSFPRALAKTERYGYSLMDTGVGLFVLMSGLVHKDLLRNHWTTVFLGNLKFFILLAGLGMARYASIKQLDYQEHVSEYGVHWNFFFTLAVCKFLSTFLLYLLPGSNSLFQNMYAITLSFTILAVHELMLYCGVQDWVFGGTPRDSFLSANREGLSSCLGYVALYIFGAHVKEELTKQHLSGNLYYKGLKIDKTFLKLVVGSILLWMLTYLSNFLRPASRTLANASYCIFIESVMLTIVSLLNYFVIYFFNEKGNFVTPKIIDNVNSNGLLIFLVANLLTGAINLSMRTLLASSFTTFVILNAYMATTLMLPQFVRKIDTFVFH